MSLLEVSFQFSDATLNRLIETIGYMQIKDEESVTSIEHVEKPDERRDGWTEVVIGQMQIGQSCSLAVLMKLIEVSYKRIDLNVDLLEWSRLVEDHVHEREKKRLSPWTFGIGEKERSLLYHAIKFGQFFLVRALLEAGAPTARYVKTFLAHFL